ncbi:MAG: nucleotidyltransferase domain-containing protein [Candidatus Omnitrophota bacterium]
MKIQEILQKPEQKVKIEAIRKKYALKFIILHGSYACGKEGEESDLDIALLAEKRIETEALLAIYAEIEEAVKNIGVKELDVKSLHGVDPLFRYFVVRDSILLAGDVHSYNEFRAYAFRDYLDSRSLRILERRMIEYKQKMLANRSYSP